MSIVYSTVQYSTVNKLLNRKLHCRREAARCSVSLKLVVTQSLEVIRTYTVNWYMFICFIIISL